MRLYRISIEQRHFHCIPTVVVEGIYGKDNNLRNAASTFISDFKLSVGRGQTSTTTSSQARDGNTVHDVSDEESTWQKVDVDNGQFSDSEKYSGIQAESPNLAEARNSYITYYNQRGFSRTDRVNLLCSVLKGPALIYWTSKSMEWNSILNSELCLNS